MKPIRMTIQGLQSYREAQTVDFAWLAEAGVFGIFGPTGSGKSTILDAVTLAMYGTVERAGNSIQGIMNAHEDTLSVSFAFQLEGGDGRRTYIAERTYRRKNDGAIEQRVCRLLEETPDGTVVLADKAGEMNDAVVKLLGLSMTDFTRAVVLPQGKFAEFLSLKGKERRLMLQRLFRLERYGDELAARLASRQRGAETDAREAAAELAGLGDASPEALAAAEEAFAAARASEERTAAALSAAEAVRTEALRIREAMAEAAAAEAALAELTGRAAEIAAMEERLALASAAERLLPVLRERERALAECERYASAAVEATRERTTAAGKHDAAKHAHALADRTLKENEAAAVARLERLRQAAAQAAQARADETALAGARASFVRMCKEREEAAVSLAALRKRRDEALALQQKLKGELAAAETPAEARRRLSAAEREREAADRAAAEAAARRGEAAAAAAAAQRREAAAARLDAEALALEAQLAAARALFAQGAGALASAGEATLLAERRLGDELLAARTAATHEQAAWAHALAAGLRDGEPCPVCGASSHPAPAVEPPTSASARQEAAAELERRLTDARELGAAARREASRAAETLHRLDAALGSAAGPALADESAAAGDAEHDPEAAAGLEQLTRRREHIESVAAKLQAVLPEVRSRLERFEAARASLREERAALAAAAGAAGEAEARAVAAERLAAEASARWSETYPEWTAATFAEALREAERKERQAEELRQRLANSEPFLEANAAELERLQQKLGEADRLCAQAEAETAAAERQLAARRAEIAALADGAEEPPETLYRELADRLESWRALERQAREALETTRALLEAAGQREAAAGEAARGAQAALERAEALWNEALSTSSFDGVEAVRRSALPKERRETLERETAAYAEQLAGAAAKRDAANARLAGRAVTEETLAAAQRRFDEAKAMREEALAQRAKAEQAAAELRRKHERWREVTQRYEDAAALQQQLAKLQQVFRGNAFVEFLAEEQLIGVTRAASERLARLTRERYAIELDSQGGFVIRDDANGGVRRPVSSLSGGETFLTSLALALALSAQIQLDGKYPLEFFFLDEGFGTLDPELLDNVVTALERLHLERLAVGVISHVPELQARLPRKLIVTPADPLGAGSRVRTETA